MNDLTGFLAASHRLVVFTGAGVSTESGIPDFRSPGGVWTRYDPRELRFDRYVADAGVRARSWQMRREFFVADAKPNPAHHAIAALETAGRCIGVVTQNIDGLHQDAGTRTVVEIHGTARTVGCIGSAPRGGVPQGCGWSAPTDWAFARIDEGDDDPSCPSCGGLVKSATVSFGQAMDESSLRAAMALFDRADAVLVVGSSLEVYPAAALPEQAAAGGVPLAIVNRDATALDWMASVVAHDTAGEVLPPVVQQVLQG